MLNICMLVVLHSDTHGTASNGCTVLPTSNTNTTSHTGSAMNTMHN